MPSPRRSRSPPPEPPPRPRPSRRRANPVPDLETACSVAAAAIAAGTSVQRLELLDATTVGMVNAYQGTSYPETPCLFVEAAGNRAAAVEDLEVVVAFARE